MQKIYKRNKSSIMFFSVLAFISAAAMVFSGYIVSYIVNTAVEVINGEQKNMNKLFIEIGICALSFLIFILFSYFQKQQKIKTIKKFNLYLRRVVIQKIVTLNLNELNSKSNGDFISWLTNDINQIERKSFENLFNFIDCFFAVILSITAIFLLNWIVALATIVSFWILMIVPGLLQKSMIKTVNNVSTKQEQFSSKVEDVIVGYRELLYNNKTEIFDEMINEKSLDLENYKQKNKNLEALQVTGIISASSICQIALLILTVILASYKWAPIGIVFAVPQLASNFLGNGQQTLQALFEMLGSKGLFTKFKYEKVELNNEKLKPFKSIVVNNLSLVIKGNTLFKDLSLEVNKGKKYLISGRSGVGKSTLIKILFGALPDYQGEILWNNQVNYSEIDRKKLWEQIYYVQQEATIFEGTFKENITLFDDSMTDKKVLEIVKLVNLEELVTKNNNTLSFECKDISKGEAQRIAIGRALLSNKKVVYLDEPTASLDKGNTELIENLILKNPDLTVLFISHTSDIKNQMFDEVIKLK
ncbi:ATP-binding cassette domain-containing protein [Mesoplasma tabanidae]|uniref:ABC transporter ATP-binding protein/permease n=1 Tax=Mesoplasma tabanidae TaxID=219745 RepID=A0A2K8P3Q9_9MOLU|nr:ABC transporter ATP-binding protein [Mesoplasma tabanidae]ATZ21379.1 ABC transporter ATP-binding protein/permease [Mesoplasma tabanidae]